MYIWGHLYDFFVSFGRKSTTPMGYAPIRQEFEEFFTRRFYRRVHVRSPLPPPLPAVALSAHRGSAPTPESCRAAQGRPMPVLEPQT